MIALVGCSMLVAGHMTVGVFQAFFQFIYEASEPMTQLSFTFNSLQALASAERVFDLLDEPDGGGRSAAGRGRQAAGSRGGPRLL